MDMFIFFLKRSGSIHFHTFSFICVDLAAFNVEGWVGEVFFLILYYSTIIPNDVGHSKSVAMAVVSGFKAPYCL